jgi:hypothetical protein
MADETLNYKKELVDEILTMYLSGMTIWEMCDYLNMGDTEINKIIDRFSPYL